MRQASLIVLILLIWNVIVFITYGIDKRRAVQKAWRISERTLLLEAICLGGLGAILGGNYFHHKTRKWYFQVTWLVGLAILVIVIYLI